MNIPVLEKAHPQEVEQEQRRDTSRTPLTGGTSLITFLITSLSQSRTRNNTTPRRSAYLRPIRGILPAAYLKSQSPGPPTLVLIFLYIFLKVEVVGFP